MANNERHRKYISYIANILLCILIFWFVQTFVDINRPVRVGLKEIDTIKIMGDSKEIFVRDQEKIDKFIGQMKYKFVIPSYYKEPPLSEGYYVLAFYKDNKAVGVFAYNIEKRLLNPRGKALSSELYDILEAFIKESYKPD